jgi:lipopolysaccharide transport system ATP-binding protein
MAVRRYYKEFWALKGLDFEIHPGETVGIVGRNGSGKSTVLQIIAGTLTPTSGTVKVNGRIAALLELGSGFNPEFTGRENVFLNGVLLGLSREEIEARLPDILAFADIGDFVDRPVKTYSSGMMLRLAFAVQAQIDPQVLIVDEALAVGDARFQAKCFARLKELKEQGTSILFVTHATEQVISQCDRAILLDRGDIVEQGKPVDVVNRYLNILFDNAQTTSTPEVVTSEEVLEGLSKDDTIDSFATRPHYNHNEYRRGDGKARILDFVLESEGKFFPPVINSGATVRLGLHVHFFESIPSPILGVTIRNKEGLTVYGTNSRMVNAAEIAEAGIAGATVNVMINFNCSLAAGDYFISTVVVSDVMGEVVPHDRRFDAIHIHVTSQGFFGITDLSMAMDLSSHVSAPLLQ